MSNAEPGNDLCTEKTYTDFKLHAEFRYPKGSNSGVYLRGRYEVQIEDNYGDEPDSHKIGGVYGLEGLPTTIDHVGSFRICAKKARPDIQVTVLYIMDMEDAASAKEAAFSLIAGQCNPATGP